MTVIILAGLLLRLPEGVSLGSLDTRGLFKPLRQGGTHNHDQNHKQDVIKSIDPFKVFGSGEAQEMRSKAFGAFSKNGNSIDFRDFVMVIHLTSNGSADEKLRLMFRMYDTDGNGSIDKAEMNK